MAVNKDIFLNFLSEQRHFFKSVFEAINDLVLVVDQTGNICHVNRQSCEQLGLDYQRVRSSNCLEVIFKEQVGFANLNQLLDECTDEKVRCWLKFKGDLELPVLLSGSVLIDDEGNQMGGVLSLRDLREEYELQSQLLHSEKWRSLGEMASGIAHEINNPLAILKGYSGLITDLVEQGEASHEDLVDSIEKMNFTIDRIANIVMGMRSLTGENTEGRGEFVDIKDLLEETLLPFSERCKHLGIELLLDIAVADPVQENWQTCDQTKQILFNLLSNSIEAFRDYKCIGKCVGECIGECIGECDDEKASEKVSKKQISLQVITSNQDSSVQFIVSDNGLGVEAKVIENIFNPFVTTKFAQKSVGLGLSVARGLAEQHGGSLIYKDNSSGGATFILELPLHTEQSRAVA